MTTKDLAWVAGFLEGEGSFGSYGCPRISAAQVQRQPLDVLKRLFGGGISKHSDRGPSRQASCQWHLNGARAVALMMTLYSWMSPRRREQIFAALSRWKALPTHPRVLRQIYGDILRTHCIHGHALSSDNIKRERKTNGSITRRCKVCYRAAMKRWYSQHGAEYQRRRRANSKG